MITEASWEAGGLVSSDDAAAVASLAELDVFGSAVPSVEWDTTDMNAMPGRTQAISMTSPSYSDSLTITRVKFGWLGQNIPPLRRCEVERVKQQTLVDYLTQGAR